MENSHNHSCIFTLASMNNVFLLQSVPFGLFGLVEQTSIQVIRFMNTFLFVLAIYEYILDTFMPLGFLVGDSIFIGYVQYLLWLIRFMNSFLYLFSRHTGCCHIEDIKGCKSLELVNWLYSFLSFFNQN